MHNHCDGLLESPFIREIEEGFRSDGLDPDLVTAFKRVAYASWDAQSQLFLRPVIQELIDTFIQVDAMRYMRE